MSSVTNRKVTQKRCSDCLQVKPMGEFYGRRYKQSRCIPCYNAAYGSYYRRALKEARTGVVATRKNRFSV